MKILQLIQKPQPRGAETFAAQLSDQLVSLGHNSVLLAIFDTHDSSKFRSPYQTLGADPASRLWDRKGWAALAAAIASQKPDIIQANAGDTLKYAVFSKMLYRWKQPIVFRNASTLSSYIKTPFQKLYNKFLYSHTDAIASVSNFSRQDLIKLYPGLVSKAITIPIGVEPARQVINPYAAFADKINLVHVGGFSFEKNHEGLLRIFSQLIKAIPAVQLWLVGDGPLRTAIEAQVKSLGLDENVKFTGFVQNPLDYIAHAKALLLPSIIEGLPGVILEAMLYNTPVVAYDVGGISEVLANGKTGWLVEAGDELAFKQAVFELIELSDVDLDVITKNAFLQVEHGYLNESIAKQFNDLYQKLLINY